MRKREYDVVEEGNDYGLANYDHITLDSDSVKENDVAFRENKRSDSIMLKENLADVEAKLVKACENSGRQRGDVTLIAVSKTKPVETLKDAYDLGVRVFGENKV